MKLAIILQKKKYVNHLQAVSIRTRFLLVRTVAPARLLMKDFVLLALTHHLPVDVDHVLHSRRTAPGNHFFKGEALALMTLDGKLVVGAIRHAVLGS